MRFVVFSFLSVTLIFFICGEECRKRIAVQQDSKIICAEILYLWRPGLLCAYKSDKSMFVPREIIILYIEIQNP